MHMIRHGRHFLLAAVLAAAAFLFSPAMEQTAAASVRNMDNPGIHMQGQKPGHSVGRHDPGQVHKGKKLGKERRPGRNMDKKRHPRMKEKGHRPDRHREKARRPHKEGRHKDARPQRRPGR